MIEGGKKCTNLLVNSINDFVVVKFKTFGNIYYCGLQQ